MTDILKKWLRDQLKGVVGVKSCVIGQEPGISDPVRYADLVVQTWTGLVAHVHILFEPINTRTIKRIVESATQIGVGSLFLVDVKLLPKNGERASPDQWYMAIHALTGRLYAYQMRENEPIIGEVHFVPVGKTTLIETQYGSKIFIQQLRCYRNSVKANIIKGYWMVADFGADATKKPPDSAAKGPASSENPRARQQYAAPPPPKTPPRQQTQSTNKSSSNSSYARSQPPRPPAPKNKLDQCYELLGVHRDSSREEVKAAFRKLAFEVHPDVSLLPKAEAELRFKLISEAYEYIKVTRGW
jgi:hypothetical protein